MKKIIVGLSLIFLGSFAHAQNGLDSLIIETYYISNANDTAVNSTGGNLPIGSFTYRIYADMLPGYKFQAAYGIPTHTLVLSTSTLFFNNEDRGATSPTYTKAQAKDNTIMLDSWLSVGAACAGNFGVPKTSDNGVSTVVNADGVLTNSVSAIGIPLTTEDGLVAGTPQAVTTVGISTEIAVFDATSGAGNLFTTDNGSWASLTGSLGPDTTTNKVLIAQITTDGQFCYEINIQIGTPTGGVQNYVAKNPAGNEIQIPSLMGCIGGVNTEPSVSITSPAGASIFIAPAIVAIVANATDADGTVDSVEFFVNNVKVGVDLSSPYQTNWTSSIGTKTLTAIATDNKGGKDTSSAVIITVNSSVGVNDQKTSGSTFKVYPNPTKDIFIMEIIGTSSQNVTTYTIYSVEGNVIFYKEHKDIGFVSGKYIESIDMSSFANGQYIIVLSLDGITSTKPIIKN